MSGELGWAGLVVMEIFKVSPRFSYRCIYVKRAPTFPDIITRVKYLECNGLSVRDGFYIFQHYFPGEKF